MKTRCPLKTKQAIAQKKKHRHTEPVVKSPNSIPIAFITSLLIWLVGLDHVLPFLVVRFISGIFCVVVLGFVKISFFLFLYFSYW
ncbi:hypothetical protein C2G38_1503112 [Gigaspora rosea]|uniref:Uncharacterized protein n=1 Tax=Gigaspora rosea TaxID=44941 RepID=A0A397V981_9GLOM|nr:hypothetical protein C2G38_1503112 [Gigaspora rosea]